MRLAFCVKTGFCSYCCSFGHFQCVVTNMESVWMCVCECLGLLCLHLALAWRGRKDWSERSGLMLAGQWAHGPVASYCHHRMALARFWHTLLFSLLPVSHPPLQTLSSSHFVDRLCVLICGMFSGNSLELICCSFSNIPTNYCGCNTQTTRNSYTQSYRLRALSWVICRCFAAPISHQPKTIYVHSSLFFSPCGGSMDLLDIYSASISNRCLLAEH